MASRNDQGISKMYVTHVETKRKFLILWSQLDDVGVTRLEELMDSCVYMLDNSLPPNMHFLSIDQIVCAKFAEDNQWYRAMVQGIDMANSQIDVFFMDYGNTEIVPACDVRTVTNELQSLPPQASMCIQSDVVPISDVWDDNVIPYVSQLVKDKEVFVKFISRQFGVDGQQTFVVNVFTDEAGDVSLAEKLVEQRLGRIISQPTKLQRLVVHPDSTHMAYVSFVDSVTDFFVQLQSEETKLNDLMAEMDIFYENLADMERVPNNVAVGANLCTKYSEDGLFYRVEVLSVSGNTANVLYVDYGNRQNVTKSSLKTLPEKFLALPMQAVHCSLFGAASQHAKNPNITKAFQNELDENVLKMVVKTTAADKVTVELFNNNSELSISWKLGLAPGRSSLQSPESSGIPPQASAGGVKCYAACILSPGFMADVTVSSIEHSCFYCQIVKDINTLDDLMTKIDYFYTDKPVPLAKNLSPGDVCCGQFTEDEIWYRAEVMSISGYQAQVRYVDYGNWEILPQSRIKVLLPEFLSVPKQAIRCSLHGIAGDTNIEKILKKYEECTFSMKVVRCSNDMAVVELTEKISGKNINQLLGAKTAETFEKPKALIPQPTLNATEHMFISAIESAGKFYGQPTRFSQDELETFLQKLNNYYTKAIEQKLFADGDNHIDDYCAVKFSVDNQWYRGKVVSVDNTQVQIRFIDYGNTECVFKNAVMCLNSMFLDYPQQAVECELSSMPPGLTHQEFETLMADTTAEIKVLSKAENNKYVVSVNSMPPSGSSGDMASNQVLRDSYIPAPVETNKPFEVVVTHMVGPDEIFCQMTATNNALINLMRELQSYCTNRGGAETKISDIKLGSPCVSKFSADNLWYRTKVVGIKKSGDVEVMFVDYGNTEFVKKWMIKAISNEFFTLPEQCVVGILSGLEHVTLQPEQIEKVQKLVLNKSFTAKCLSWESNRWKMELTDVKGNNVSQKCRDMISSLPPASLGAIPKQDSWKPKPNFTDFSIPKLNHVGEAHEDGWDDQSESGKTWGAASSSSSLFTVQNAASSFAGTKSKKLPWQDGGASSFLSRDVAVNQNENSWDEQPMKKEPGMRKYVPQPMGAGFVNVAVEYLLTPSEFYCQLSSETRKLDEIMTKLESRYNQLSFREEEITNASIGMPCCARYSEDNHWYRAEIIAVEGKSVKVQFVDYGNVETVDSREIKAIQSDLLLLPKQALKCSLAGVKPKRGDWSDDDIKQFENMVMFSDVAAKRVSTTADGTFLVELESETNNENIASAMVKAGAALSTNDLESSLDRSRSLSPRSSVVGGYEEPVINSGQKERVFISWVVNPDHFYCQLARDEAKLEEMKLALQTYYASIAKSSADSLKSPQVNMPCVAKYSEDGAWYRAQIISISGDAIQVLFVDYGNTDTRTLRELKQIKTEFLLLPRQAISCRLKGVKPAGHRWATPTHSFLADLFGDESVCTFYAKFENTYLVDIDTVKGKNVAHELISQKFANPTTGGSDRSGSESSTTRSSSLPKSAPVAAYPIIFLDVNVGDFADVVISHIEDVSKFWIQMCEFSPKLDTVMQALNEYYDSLTEKQLRLGNANTGTCCAIKHEEDGLWHRGRVLKRLSPSKVEVFFVDIGTVDIVHITQLRTLLPEYAELAPQAVQCSLSGISVVNPESTDAFKTLTSKNLLLVLVDEKDDDRLCVTLFDVSDGGEVNVNEALLKDESLNLIDEAVSNVEPVTAEEAKHIEPVTAVGDASAFDEEATSAHVFKYQQLSGEEDCFVSYSLDPGCFWIHLSRQEDLLGDLSRQVEEYCSKSRPCVSPTIGAACLAKSTEYQTWYRAEVTKIADRVLVQFVDYGNSERVNTENIVGIPDNLLKEQALAIRCRANIAPPGDSWTASAIERFEELTAEKALVINVVCDTIVPVVDITEGSSESVENIMVKEGLAIGFEQKSATDVLNLGVKTDLPPADAEFGDDNIVDENEGNMNESVASTEEEFADTLQELNDKETPNESKSDDELEFDSAEEGDENAQYDSEVSATEEKTEVDQTLDYQEKEDETTEENVKDMLVDKHRFEEDVVAEPSVPEMEDQLPSNVVEADLDESDFKEVLSDEELDRELKEMIQQLDTEDQFSTNEVEDELKGSAFDKLLDDEDLAEDLENAEVQADYDDDRYSEDVEGPDVYRHMLKESFGDQELAEAIRKSEVDSPESLDDSNQDEQLAESERGLSARASSADDAVVESDKDITVTSLQEAEGTTPSPVDLSAAGDVSSVEEKVNFEPRESHQQRDEEEQAEAEMASCLSDIRAQIRLLTNVVASFEVLADSDEQAQLTESERDAGREGAQRIVNEVFPLEVPLPDDLLADEDEVEGESIAQVKRLPDTMGDIEAYDEYAPDCQPEDRQNIQHDQASPTEDDRASPTKDDAASPEEEDTASPAEDDLELPTEDERVFSTEDELGLLPSGLKQEVAVDIEVGKHLDSEMSGADLRSKTETRVVVDAAVEDDEATESCQNLEEAVAAELETASQDAEADISSETEEDRKDDRRGELLTTDLGNLNDEDVASSPPDSPPEDSHQLRPSEELFKDASISPPESDVATSTQPEDRQVIEAKDAEVEEGNSDFAQPEDIQGMISQQNENLADLVTCVESNMRLEPALDVSVCSEIANASAFQMPYTSSNRSPPDGSGASPSSQGADNDLKDDDYNDGDDYGKTSFQQTACDSGILSSQSSPDVNDDYADASLIDPHSHSDVSEQSLISDGTPFEKERTSGLADGRGDDVIEELVASESVQSEEVKSPKQIGEQDREALGDGLEEVDTAEDEQTSTCDKQQQQQHSISESNIAYIIPKFEVRTTLDVYVPGASLQTCQEFWCQLASSRGCNPVLEEQLQDYCSKGGDILEDPSVGRSCVAPYGESNDWWVSYRSVITDVSNEDADVRFVDYGTTARVHKSRLLKPQADFSASSVQAFQCSLAGITAPPGDQEEKLQHRFEELVQGKLLRATIQRISDTKAGLHQYEVSLVDAETDVDVAEELVKSGYAQEHVVGSVDGTEQDSSEFASN